jgi:hypothetical protein
VQPGEPEELLEVPLLLLLEVPLLVVPPELLLPRPTLGRSESGRQHWSQVAEGTIVRPLGQPSW